jgi:hypothetical protein
MSEEPDVSVPRIMLEIEERLRAGADDREDLWAPDLDPELRAQLIRLREMAGGLQFDVPAVEQSSIPLLGPLVDRARKQLHQLVLFYAAGMARHQVALAQSMVRTLVYLAEHYAAENRALRAELKELRRELAQGPTE